VKSKEGGGPVGNQRYNTWRDPPPREKKKQKFKRKMEYVLKLGKKKIRKKEKLVVSHICNKEALSKETFLEV